VTPEGNGMIHFSPVKTEAVVSCETLAVIYETTRFHIPENRNMESFKVSAMPPCVSFRFDSKIN
jgi:hypothetical protein